jgi:formylmethanofuran dehydrogenase subunit E
MAELLVQTKVGAAMIIEACGERVMDIQYEQKDGKVLCRPCAVGTNCCTDRVVAGT